MPAHPLRRRAATARAPLLAAAVVGLVSALAACGTSGGGAAGTGVSSPATATAPSTAPVPSSAPTPTRTPKPEPVTIAFAGDVHLEGPLRQRLADPATALAPVAPLLAGADLAVVNLESAVGTGGTPEPKRFRFQAPPSVFPALAAAGVDVVTMANNHAKDFGDDGLAETLAAIGEAESADPPLSVVGVGADLDEALSPAVREVRGTTTVAVIGAHSADDPTADPTAQWAAGEGRPGVAVVRDDLAPLLAAVRAASETADAVVVYMHWGVQGESCPTDSQRSTARALADSGAAAVVGTHAHELQGAGTLGGTYVAYGLGNFVWYRPGASGVLTLTLLGGEVVGEAWTPVLIGDDGLPVAVEGAAAGRLAGEFSALRDCTDLAALG